MWKWLILLSVLLWPAQVSPACSLWEQSVWFFRERGQSHRWISFPLHSTLFSHTTPSPAPKTEFPSALSAAPQPSCLQTTWASLMSHRSAQTEPHTALWYTSSLPEHRPEPPLSLRGTWSKSHTATSLTSNTFTMYFMTIQGCDKLWMWNADSVYKCSIIQYTVN